VFFLFLGKFYFFVDKIGILGDNLDIKKGAVNRSCGAGPYLLAEERAFSFSFLRLIR